MVVLLLTLFKFQNVAHLIYIAYQKNQISLQLSIREIDRAHRQQSSFCMFNTGISPRQCFVFVLVYIVCKQTKTFSFLLQCLLLIVSVFETLDGPWNYMLSVKQNRHARNSICVLICPGQMTVKILIELRFINIHQRTSCLSENWLKRKSKTRVAAITKITFSILNLYFFFSIKL